MKKIKLISLFALILLMAGSADAQNPLKKLKAKINQTVNKTIDNEVEKKTGLPTNQPEEAEKKSNPKNKGGGGLSNTEPPDVNAMMAEAVTMKSTGKYSDARYSLSQALMGVEIQLGRAILKSLPSSSGGLPADTLQDKVMSTQWGWSNLSIQRVYKNNDDKQMTMVIGNAGIYGGLAQLYFANAGMVEVGGQEQNVKQIRVKGNRGMIEYDEDNGYTLVIGLGQTSGIVWECINFATEQEVMNAVNSFDIDGIKKMLGEQ